MSTSMPSTGVSLDSLPKELLGISIGLLSGKDRSSTSKVNKGLHQTTVEETVWAANGALSLLQHGLSQANGGLPIGKLFETRNVQMPAMGFDKCPGLESIQKKIIEIKHALILVSCGLTSDKLTELEKSLPVSDLFEFKNILELIKERNNTLARVQENGLELRRIPVWMIGDVEINMAAVQQNGLALAYVNAELKNNREIVKAAVAQNSAAFAWGGENLCSNKEFVFELIRDAELSIGDIHGALAVDREIIRAAVARDPTEFYRIHEEVQGDLVFMNEMRELSGGGEIFLDDVSDAEGDDLREVHWNDLEEGLDVSDVEGDDNLLLVQAGWREENPRVGSESDAELDEVVLGEVWLRGDL